MPISCASQAFTEDTQASGYIGLIGTVVFFLCISGVATEDTQATGYIGLMDTLVFLCISCVACRPVVGICCVLGFLCN